MPERNREALPGAAGDLPEPADGDRPAVSWRSIALGLIGVVLICGLTPYNDQVISNTYLIGNFFPVGIAAFFIFVVLAVNGPLCKWAPRWALSSGELAVALGMALVSCTIPGAGLMWYWPGFLVAPAHYAAADPALARLLESLNLPQWMFPRYEATTLAEQGYDRVVVYFYARAPLEVDTLEAQLRAVPWSAWLMPAATWGLLLAALWGAVLCLSVILRRQWIENERLPFPLATIYVSLIERPRPGRALNTMFSSRAFWIAFLAVFIIHGINGLSVYFPKLVPQIPLSFDLHGVFANEPWVYFDWRFKRQTLFFSIIGIMFFVQTKIAFSIWFFYFLLQIIYINYGLVGAQYTEGMQMDQVFAALLVFVGILAWTGRHHWMMVLRQMFRGRRPDEPQDRYLPYWLAGWGLAVCLAGMATWLVIAGMTVIGAIVLIMMLMLVYLVLARVVAETGLFFTQVQLLLYRPWVLALAALPGEIRTSNTSYFFTTWLNGMIGHDTRESLPVFATHALRITDQAAPQGRRWGIWFIAALAVALAVGYVVAGSSMLFVQYSYATTQDQAARAPLNPYGTVDAPRWQFLDPLRQYVPPSPGPRERHSHVTHFGIGAVVMGALSVLRLRYAHWPLHPIGYLLMYSPSVARIYFSIFLGWLCKALIVRYGGVQLFRSATFFFIGLIVGEVGASAFWLLASLVLNMMGAPFHPIRLMPGS